jgi:cytochrome c-type biogenesis protein
VHYGPLRASFSNVTDTSLLTMTDVSLAGAFLAGLISFLSPCVLPLVPGYISMLSGIGMDQLRDGKAPSSQLLASALAFVSGLSIVFIALGASASAIGELLKEHRNSLTPIAGALVLLFGLHLLGVLAKLNVRLGIAIGAVLAALGVLSLVRHAPLFADFGAVQFFSLSLIGFFGPFITRWLNRDVHLRSSAAQPGVWSAFFLGFAFAFGWSPCLGPIVGAVLSLAAASGTVARGVLLLAVYSAGLSIPFLITALEMTRFLKFYQSFRKYLHWVELFSGGLLVFIGALVFLNKLAWLTARLNFLNALTAGLEGPLTGAAHSPLFWILIALSALALLILAFIRYREVFSAMPRAKTLLVIGTVAFLIAVTIFADRATRVSGAPAGGVHIDSQVAGKPEPELNLKTVDGKDVSLADYKGKVVFVNFWATWCDPCRVEIPWLIAMQNKYGPKGFTVVGIAMDEEGKSAVAPFLDKERFDVDGQKLPMNYPIVLGTDEAADKFGGILGYPSSFLISRDGKIVTKFQGLKSEDELTKAIESQL